MYLYGLYVYIHLSIQGLVGINLHHEWHVFFFGLMFDTLDWQNVSIYTYTGGGYNWTLSSCPTLLEGHLSNLTYPFLLSLPFSSPSMYIENMYPFAVIINHSSLIKKRQQQQQSL